MLMEAWCMHGSWTHDASLASAKLDPLTGRLDRARRRYRWLLILRAILWGLAAAGAAYALALLLPMRWSPVTTLLAVAAFTAALAPVYGWLRTPDRLAMARRADRTFTLAERASTAIEVAMRPLPEGREGRVHAALIDDAARHTERIDPVALSRVPLSRSLWLLLAVAATALALRAALPAIQDWRAPVAPEVSAPFEPAARETLLADVQRAAELMLLEAEERNDPYLQAVSDAFMDLGERLESGAVDAAEAERELDRLLSHAAEAIGLEASAVIADVPLPPEAFDGGDAPATGAPVGDGSGSSAEVAPDLGELLDALEGAEEERQARQAAQADAGDLGYAAEIQRDSEARLERLAAAGQDGQIVGAADESQQGPGPLGGQGSQPLEGEAELPLFDAATSEDVLLPGFEPDAQERVETERTPDTQLTEVASDAGAVAAPLAPAREAELRHDRLSPEHVEVARRYFDRSLVDEGTTQQ
jgi:hypothetical protein